MRAGSREGAGGICECPPAENKLLQPTTDGRTDGRGRRIAQLCIEEQHRRHQRQSGGLRFQQRKMQPDVMAETCREIFSLFCNSTADTKTAFVQRCCNLFQLSGLLFRSHVAWFAAECGRCWLCDTRNVTAEKQSTKLEQITAPLYSLHYVFMSSCCV